MVILIAASAEIGVAILLSALYFALAEILRYLAVIAPRHTFPRQADSHRGRPQANQFAKAF